MDWTWDLSVLYTDFNDPQIEKDFSSLKEICENVKLPEELITTEGEHTYWLQEEHIEWMNESPINKIRYLYEKKTGFKRGICLFFKNHHIVYYNPGYEYGDREVMLCDADLETIMTEYDYILDK